MVASSPEPEPDGAGTPPPSLHSRSFAERSARAAGVIALLSLLSLWSWRQLITEGFGAHLPSFATVGDVGQGVLFLSWLPYALGHHLNPLFSRLMDAPYGVNMASNTAFFLTALCVAPITVLAGPVASFDLGVVVAPVLSAYACYAVLRRYDLRPMAAFAGAMFFGYSPYLMQEDKLGHFNLSWMFFPPLLVYLLDEVVARQRWTPVRSGLALGALVVVEYVNSPEILLEGALLAAIVLLVLALAHPRAAWRRLPHAATATGLAVLVAGVVLAYPIWFATAGPEHVTTFNSSVSTIDNAVTSALWPSGVSVFHEQQPFWQRIDSGFVGPVAVVAVAASVLLVRRHRLVGPLLLGAVVSYVLTWGPYLRISSSGFTHVRGPDYWLLDLPILRNVQEYRFAAFTDLCVGFLAAICLDRLLAAAERRRVVGSRPGRAAVGVVALVGLLAVPMLGWSQHEAVEAVSAPRVFTAPPLSTLPAGSVAVVLPSEFINAGAPLVWQAVAGMGLEETTGYAWRPVDRAGLGTTLPPFDLVTSFLGPSLFGPSPPLPATISGRTLSGLRAELLGWKVAAVVFADRVAAPGGPLDRLMTTVLGQPPAAVGSSLVWVGVGRLLARHGPRYRLLRLY